MSTRKLFPLILFGAILCACQAKKTESPEGFSGSGFVATLTPVVDSELAESAGKQSGLTREAVLEKLQTLGKAIRASRKDGSPGRSKSALESALWPGKNIVYNKDHSNITHVLSSPRLQCRSGSLVYALALLSSFANQAEYDAVHPVFIVEPGHVLPGFLKREKDDWHLTGIEMTASGDGIKDYGLTRSLKGSMRVSDMKAYLELFQSRDGLGKNAEARYKAEDQILAEAAKQYAVPLDALEKSIKDEYPDARDGKKLFHDFLQFAEVDVPEGDRERREVTETVPKEEIVSTRQSGGVTPWQDGPDGALTREIPGGTQKLISLINKTGSEDADSSKIIVKDFRVEKGDRIHVRASGSQVIASSTIMSATDTVQKLNMKLNGTLLGKEPDADYMINQTGTVSVDFETAPGQFNRYQVRFKRGPFSLFLERCRDSSGQPMECPDFKDFQNGIAPAPDSSEDHPIDPEA